MKVIRKSKSVSVTVEDLACGDLFEFSGGSPVYMLVEVVGGSRTYRLDLASGICYDAPPQTSPLNRVYGAFREEDTL